MIALKLLITLFLLVFFFFFNDTATTEIYTLSLHDALPICLPKRLEPAVAAAPGDVAFWRCANERAQAQAVAADVERLRSEEHTSELQSRQYLVCRLLLEKKKKYT